MLIGVGEKKIEYGDLGGEWGRVGDGNDISKYLMKLFG